MVYRTAPFAMILNNLWPIFQGHAILDGPVNNNCDNPLCTYGDASVNLCSSQPATCTTTTKIKQNSVRSVKSEAQHYLRSTYCSEANDRHEASRGLFATAELLVFILRDVSFWTIFRHVRSIISIISIKLYDQCEQLIRVLYIITKV